MTNDEAQLSRNVKKTPFAHLYSATHEAATVNFGFKSHDFWFTCVRQPLYQSKHNRQPLFYHTQP